MSIYRISIGVQEVVQELTLQQHLERVSNPLEDLSKTYTKILIDDQNTFDHFLEGLEKSSIFAYDCETNGKLDRFEVSLVGMSFCYDDDTAFYLPFNHHEGQQLDIVECLEILRPFFESDEYEKICHNVKFDEMVLNAHGIDVKGAGHCTFIISWLLYGLTEKGTRGLKPLTYKEYGVEMETYEDVIAGTAKQRGVDRDYNFAPVGLAEALSYAADDAYWAWKLYHLYKPQLDAQRLWPAYDAIERPIIRVLRKVEHRGVTIDQELLDHADQRLPKIIEQVEADIYEQAGKVFNIGSPPQLGKVLFEELKVAGEDTENVPKTDTGKFKTDKDTLELYSNRHNIVNDILRRKKITKTHSTFVEGTRGFIARDGKIHPSFNSSGTITGRFSCTKPNLQQIEGDEVEEIRVRNFFVPSEGHRFVVADYGQIELRIMAHFSKDKNLIAAFLSGRDFHEETARKMFALPDNAVVLPRQRFGAKAINFGIGYGRGPTSIAEQIGCSVSEAQGYIKDWERAFAGVIAYKEHVLKQTRKYGYVRTISGRKRHLPKILSDNWKMRGGAERQAFNTKIQGSAADIIKLAMIALAPRLEPYNAHMILQIHDELVVDCPEEHTEEVKEIVAHTMANPVKDKNPLILPLDVDPKIVDRWGDAK